MKKILPNLYKGRISQSKNQNRAVVEKVKENVKNVVEVENDSEPKSINRKIKDIFSSPNYVYKADVSIQMNDGTSMKKTIIGRTNNSLITMDDELIDVSKIERIDFTR